MSLTVAVVDDALVVLLAAGPLEEDGDGELRAEFHVLAVQQLLLSFERRRKGSGCTYKASTTMRLAPSNAAALPLPGLPSA